MTIVLVRDESPPDSPSSTRSRVLLRLPRKASGMFRAQFAMHSTIKGGRCHLTVGGELDETTQLSFSSLSCLRLSQAEVDELVIDLSGVTFMGAGGVNALVEIQRISDAFDKLLTLSNLSHRVLRVLELTAMTAAFRIESDVPVGA